MQKLISQIPELSLFLARTPKSHHTEAVKQLIRLGLEATRAYFYKENDANSPNAFKKELESIKSNIEALSFMIRQQFQYQSPYSPQQYPPNIPTAAFQTQKGLNDQNTFGKNACNITKPTQDKNDSTPANCIAQAKENVASFSPFSKKKAVTSRHHLDDSGVRQALQFPPEALIQAETRIKRRSQDYKKHVYQQEINRQELARIRQEKGESLDKSRRDRTVSDYARTTSKIKALLDKDRIRFMQRRREHEFQQGFDKYEYSDESQMEESSLRDESEKEPNQSAHPRFPEGNAHDPHYQSSFKGSSHPSSHNKASSKKKFSKKELSGKIQRSLEEPLDHQTKSKSGSKGELNSYQHLQDGSQGVIRNIEYEQDDVVSNSSSFSQFSISGSRQKEVGKISRRSHND